MDSKEKSIENNIESNKEKKAKRVYGRNVHRRELSFDAYFQVLMQRDSKILHHHKAPMKKFAADQGFKIGTLEEFDRIFRLY